MELQLDLHIHSERSPDGRMTLDEIIRQAREQGLDGVAVCDHDRLCPTAREGDFLVIPGEEFSTEYGHLLGLFLHQPITWDSVPELIEKIHAQGGLAVLAHPFARHADRDRIAPILPLLDGLEVFNGRADRKRKTANAEAFALAEETALARFAGSDAHVAREIGNGIVTVQAEARTLTAVRQALLQPGNPVSGRSGRHLDVARSQLTKLNKTNAGPGARLKWLLFAAKCALEDLGRS